MNTGELSKYLPLIWYWFFFIECQVFCNECLRERKRDGMSVMSGGLSWEIPNEWKVEKA